MKRIATAGVAVALAAGCVSADRPERAKSLEIVASDYAFHVPSSLAAGRWTFKFVNRGKVRHELNITRLKPGVSIDQFLQVVRADQSVKDLSEGPVGVLFAAPESRSSAGLTVDLRPGDTYAVICIFRDSTGAKRHYDLGMYSLISVPGTPAAAPVPPADVDTIIATDYAFQYPRTVAPGIHTFFMRNDGKMRHQLDVALLKEGVTFQRLREVEKAGGDVEALFDGSFGLLHSRSGQSPVGQLTIDMLPGREYVIACFFKDDEKSPEHYELGMYGSITTSPKPAT